MVTLAVDTAAPSAARKIAILLVALGEDLAAPLLRGLREEQVDAITREIVQMQRVSADEQLEVFERLYRDAVNRPSGGVAAGAGFAREILSRSLGTQRAHEVLTRVGSSPRGEAFDFVKGTDVTQIVGYFEGEHPQTVALALAHMPAEVTGQILVGLAPDVQAEVAIRLARTSRTDPEVVKGVEAALRRKMQFSTTDGLRAVGGMEYLVDVLTTCDSRSELAIMQAIQELDSELAQELRDRMFTFNDLAVLDDRSIQRLLRATEQRDLAVALRGASDEVRARVFRNMSSRAAQTLREDMDRYGPSRLRMVEEAQQRIVATARRLHDEQEIVLPRGRQDVFI